MPSSIRSVHCKHNTILKSYTKVYKSKLKLKTPTTPKIKKRSQTLINDFKWSGLILQTSRSINNPFKVISSLQNLKRPDFENKNENFTKVSSKRKSLPVSDFDYNKKNKVNITDEYFVIENFEKNLAIENKTKEMVKFLNQVVFHGAELDEIILDFIQDENMMWLFVDCGGYSLKNKPKSELLDLNLQIGNKKRPF